MDFKSGDPFATTNRRPQRLDTTRSTSTLGLETPMTGRPRPRTPPQCHFDQIFSTFLTFDLSRWRPLSERSDVVFVLFSFWCNKVTVSVLRVRQSFGYPSSILLYSGKKEKVETSEGNRGGYNSLRLSFGRQFRLYAKTLGVEVVRFRLISFYLKFQFLLWLLTGPCHRQ